ncbi:MAG: LamG domain-containing protein [Gemmataceae bacterium]
MTADVTIPNSAKLNFAKNQGFTIAGWVKLASGGEEGTILAFVNTKGRSLILLEVSKGQPVAKIRKDSSGFDTGVRGNDQLPPGRWQHLAMARHPDGTLELFVNGESVKRAKHRAHFAVADGIVKTDSRAIGKYLRHSRLHRNERRPFKGMLDEFCIFDRVLTERAVIVLAGRLDPMYLAGKIEPPRVTKMPGLLAHWSFDEGKGEIVVDGSDNRLLGTLKGAKWVDGVVGKAVEFDGKSTYLKFERSPKMNFPKNGPFTITGWVKPAETEGTILSFRNGKEDGGLIDLHMHQGKLHVQVRQDGSIFSPTQIQSVVLPQGKWSHFLLSRNPNGNVTLLLNGKGGISRNTPLYRHSKGPISADLCVLGCEKYWVDKNYRGANEDRRWFRGAVDELYVFGRELNTEELATLLARK